MNLIEQLGGYEKAKDHRDYLIDFGNEFNRPNKYEVNKINNALLEYRRQHNIFEVGDFVCFKTLGDGYVHKYTKYHEFKYDLKHATDEEIKAGRRL